MNIAIDGPAGAGKSTVSKELAKKLGFIYVDTGALYRSLAYKTISCNIEISNCYEFLKQFKVTLQLIDNFQHVFVDDEDVTDKIRTPEVSRIVPKISSIPEIRQFLLDIQRQIAYNNSVVMDGRDIGTVILPDADVKIFLTASAEERAKRRYLELEKTPNCPDFNTILADIEKRDYEDIHREIAPLKQAEDAILVDSTKMNQQEVIDTLYKICKEKMG
jgi:cytidylate kinase